MMGTRRRLGYPEHFGEEPSPPEPPPSVPPPLPKVNQKGDPPARRGGSAFTSEAPFNAEHPDTIVLYCSDGRFRRAVFDLLSAEQHPRYDAMNMPGGPALLDMSSASILEVEAMRIGTSFLIKGHSIKTAYLVAHDNCGFYKKKYAGQSPQVIRERQLRDLQAAGLWVNKNHPNVEVILYVAVAESASVTFHPIEAADPSKFIVL